MKKIKQVKERVQHRATETGRECGRDVWTCECGCDCEALADCRKSFALLATDTDTDTDKAECICEILFFRRTTRRMLCSGHSHRFVWPSYLALLNHLCLYHSQSLFLCLASKF